MVATQSLDLGKSDLWAHVIHKPADSNDVVVSFFVPLPAGSTQTETSKDTYPSCPVNMAQKEAVAKLTTLSAQSPNKKGFSRKHSPEQTGLLRFADPLKDRQHAPHGMRGATSAPGKIAGPPWWS